MAMAITVSQMRKIYAMAREYGLDNELLHSHVHAVTGKEHLKELTKEEAITVIDRLEHHSSKDPMTAKQRRYIVGLCKDIGWVGEDGKLDEKRLNGFCSKRFGIDHFKWLSRSTASNVIEGLKNMLKNKEENDGN